MSRRAPFLTGLAVLLALAPLGAQTPLTLSAALRQAATGSVQADLAGFADLGAAQDGREIQASFLPEILLTGGHLNLDRDAALLTPAFQLGPFAVPALENPVAQKSSWRYRLTADYLLYDFGKRGNALAASRARSRAVSFQGRQAVRKAQAEAAARYLAVLNVRARQVVVAQRRQALQDHLKDARALFEQGVVARNDLLRAEMALRGIDDAGAALGNRLASALEGLNVALGLAPGSAQSLPAALGPPPALPWDEAQVRQRALQANEDLKALRAKVEAFEAQVRFRQRDAGPNLVAQVGHSYEENRFLVHPQQTTLYLGLSWKLFDGGARAAKVSRAQAETDSGRRELLEASRLAESAAASARRGFQEAVQEMATAASNVAAASENLRIIGDQYQQGYAKGADVLDAESLLAESRFALVDRHCNAYTQQAALLAILGEDLAAFYDATREQ
jgi:outer membrane protein TolC